MHKTTQINLQLRFLNVHIENVFIIVSMRFLFICHVTTITTTTNNNVNKRIHAFFCPAISAIIVRWLTRALKKLFITFALDVRCLFVVSFFLCVIEMLNKYA